MTPAHQKLFKDIMAFEYSFSLLDKEIRTLLTTGVYNPIYTPLVQKFLSQEFPLFFRFMSQDELVIDYSGTLCDSTKTPDFQKVAQFLKETGIEDPQQQDLFKENLVTECLGAGFIHTYQTTTGPKDIYLYDMVENPIYSIHTVVHELAHALQRKKNFTLYGQQLPDHREIHANLMADTFILIKAYQTKDPLIIQKAERQLRHYAATVSCSVKQGRLGVRYFDWRGLCQIAKEMPRKYQTLLDQKGNIDWDKMYLYTIDILKQMNYTPEKIQEFKHMATPSWEEAPKSQAFLDLLEPHLHQNNILDDLYESMTYFINHPYTRMETLQQFYQMIANPNRREQTLSWNWKNISRISAYRLLYQSAQKKETSNPIPPVRIRKSKGQEKEI